MAVMLVLLVVPGLLVGLAARMPLRVALAASLPVTYGVVTLATYTFGLVGVSWSIGTFALGTLIVVGVVLAASMPFVGVPDPRRLLRPRPPDMRWSLLPAGGVAASAWLIGQTSITELSGTPRGLSNVFQGWDSHWHASYIKFISDTGLASPDQAGELRHTETGAPLYYPSSWHSLAALLHDLTGADIPQVYNLMQIGSLALAFPLGVAALTWLILHRWTSARTTATAAAAAAVATSLFPALPYVEMRVAATPYAASMGLFGLVAALVVAGLADRRITVPAVLALIGIGGVHPSALAAAAGTVVFWWLFEALRRPVRGRLRDFALLAVIGGAGALTLLPQLLVMSEDSEAIAAFEFAEPGERYQQWLDAISLQVRHVDSFGIREELLVLGAIGLVFTLTRKIYWVLVLWAAILLVTVNAMGVLPQPWGGWLRVVGSTFYNDPRRLGLLLAVLVAALVGAGVAALVWLLAEPVARLIDPITDPEGRGARTWWVAMAMAALVALGSWAVHIVPGLAVYGSTTDRDGRLNDLRDVRAFEWLSEQPHAYDGHIFTNPDEGSGWMYALEGLPSTSRHYLQPGQEAAPLLTHIFWSLDRAGVDPTVDDALAEMDINYVYISPPNYWSFQDPNEMLLNLEGTPGLVEVYEDWQVQIFAVSQEFTEAELEEIAAASPFPPEQRAPLTRAVELYGPEVDGESLARAGSAAGASGAATPGAQGTGVTGTGAATEPGAATAPGPPPVPAQGPAESGDVAPDPELPGAP